MFNSALAVKGQLDMKMKDSLDGYDYELPLMDALADPDLPVRRRLLAGATVGIGLDIVHFAVSEMTEAFWLLKDETERGKNCSEGYLMLEAILEEKNAFQMRLWHLLDETPLNDAAYDLAWLKALTYQRGQMANSVRKAGLPVIYASAADLLADPTAASIMAATPQFG
jgi:hypothetical protein